MLYLGEHGVHPEVDIVANVTGGRRDEGRGRVDGCGHGLRGGGWREDGPGGGRRDVDGGGGRQKLTDWLTGRGRETPSPPPPRGDSRLAVITSLLLSPSGWL